MTPIEIEKIISSKLDCKFISVDGDGVHFESVIVSDNFLGLNRVARHQMVYRSLGDKMKEEIHALSIKAFTTEEWAKKKSGKI